MLILLAIYKSSNDQNGAIVATAFFFMHLASIILKLCGCCQILCCRILSFDFLLKKIDIGMVVTTEPTIETYCEVYDTNVPWYRQKQIIWRETKFLKFAHLVDVTEPEKI